MGVADVVSANDAGQFAWCLKHNTVVKHLYLDFRSLDAIVAVTNRVDHHLLYHELRILSVGAEDAVLAKIRMLLYLGFKIINSLLYLVEYAPFKGYIFDDIHLTTNLLFGSGIADKAHTGTREETLGMLAEKENTSRAYLRNIILVGYEALVLGEILYDGLAITDAIHIGLDNIHVNIFEYGIISRAVLEILKSATIIQYTIKGRFMSR